MSGMFEDGDIQLILFIQTVVQFPKMGQVFNVILALWVLTLEIVRLVVGDRIAQNGRQFIHFYIKAFLNYCTLEDP